MKNDPVNEQSKTKKKYLKYFGLGVLGAWMVYVSWIVYTPYLQRVDWSSLSFINISHSSNLTLNKTSIASPNCEEVRPPSDYGVVNVNGFPRKYQAYDPLWSFQTVQFAVRAKSGGGAPVYYSCPSGKFLNGFNIAAGTGTMEIRLWCCSVGH